MPAPNFGLIADRARDVTWQLRIRGALVVKSRAVFAAGEAASGSAAFSYAAAVLRDPLQYGQTAAWAVATDAAIIGVPLATTVTDDQIEAGLNTAWPGLITLR